MPSYTEMCGTTKSSVVAGYYNPGAEIHHDVGINTVSSMTLCRAAYRYESILSGSSFGSMLKVGCCSITSVSRHVRI